MAERNINIAITNKKAEIIGTPVIVCGNSDYTATFTFDDEWNLTGPRTARFVYVKDGKVQHTDAVFPGNVVAVPILENVDFVDVGVFAGNLCTTTPARVRCKKSILCGSGTPQDPTPDVYDQIMELFNEMAEAGAFGATEAQAQQIAKNKSDIAQLDATKAEQTDLANLTASVGQNSQSITKNAQDIAQLEATKAAQTDMAALAARMDTFTKLDEGSTTGDAELIDTRVGYDGTQYETAGAAVRGQVSALHTKIEEEAGQLSSEIEDVENDFTQLANGYYPLKIINGQYYELGGVIHDYNSWSRTDYTPIKGDRIVLYATGEAEYCCFFTDSKTNAIANFKLNVGENIIEVPQNKNITFFGVSCDTEHINNLKYKWFVDEKADTCLSEIESLKNANINYVQMFNKILCIGDSITEGYRDVGGIDKTRSYPDYLQRILNTTVDNGGISGQTPKTWYEMRISGDYHPFDFSTYDVFIINLGQNEGLTDTLDTDVNAYTNAEDFADTQTGWYCRIIEYIKSQNSNCMVFLCKGQKDTTTNNVISKIGVKYNYPVIDYVAINPNLADDVASRHTSKSGDSYTCHYNTLGYFELANAINKGMNDYIIANIERFKEVMQ